MAEAVNVEEVMRPMAEQDPKKQLVSEKPVSSDRTLLEKKVVTKPLVAPVTRTAPEAPPSGDAAGGAVAAPVPGEMAVVTDAGTKMFTFFEELAGPIKQVAQTAWNSRWKLANDVKSYTLMAGSMAYSMPFRAIKVIQNPKLHQLIAEEEDPEALAAVVFGAGGALCLGSAGAVVGMTVGGIAGTAAGAVPAIFTFGLSLPIGAAVGGGCGLAVGAFIGGTAGFVGGAISGGTTVYFRGEIQQGVLYVGGKIYDVYDFCVIRPVSMVTSTSRMVQKKVIDSTRYTREKAGKVGSAVKNVALDQRVQVTVVTAGTGAAALGTLGAAAGAISGGIGGALVGLVPAVFTFGLSIPAGAVIGGSTGMAVGGLCGSATGFFGGGVVGFLGYTYRGLPVDAFKYSWEMVRPVAEKVHLVATEKVD